MEGTPADRPSGSDRPGFSAMAWGAFGVIALIAVGSLAVLFKMASWGRMPRDKVAKLDCQTVRKAAEIEQLTEGDGAGCPTLADLVLHKKLDPARIEDPWRTPFAIECWGSDIRVVSAGPDRAFGTTDDIRDPDPKKP